jgi:hypothetical protein
MTPRTLGCIAIVIVAGVLECLVIAASFILGGITEDRELYHKRYQREAAAIRQVFSTSPDFANLTIHEASNGYAYLKGTVPDQASFDRLTTLVHMEVGKSMAPDRLSRIKVLSREESAQADARAEADPQ